MSVSVGFVAGLSSPSRFASSTVSKIPSLSSSISTVSTIPSMSVSESNIVSVKSSTVLPSSSSPSSDKSVISSLGSTGFPPGASATPVALLLTKPAIISSGAIEYIAT